jgi:predicted nuclease with TOPRIM domain
MLIYFKIELTEKFNENSENIRKLEKENSSLREEATCFKENVDGLKGKYSILIYYRACIKTDG